MTMQLSLSSQIYDALFKAKEITDNEIQNAQDWITDIIENNKREKKNECEICGSNKKLEMHHVRGRKHGNELITVCWDCHKNLTDNQKLWDRSWLDPDSEYKDAFLTLGLINVCELKYQKTGQEIYKEFANQLKGGFSYD